MSTISQSVQHAACRLGLVIPRSGCRCDQYEKLVASGVFTKRDKLQLIDGILVTKVTQSPTQCVADLLCGKALTRVIPTGWHLRPDKPV